MRNSESRPLRVRTKGVIIRENQEAGETDQKKEVDR